MRPWLKRTRFRAFLAVFVPLFFVVTVLAAPRMLIDWSLRREWLDDFNSFFKRQTYVDMLKAFRLGHTI